MSNLDNQVNSVQIDISEEKPTEERETSIVEDAPPSHSNEEENTTNANLPEKVRILKEAFPSTELEVIEMVLQSQNDNMETSIELLLGMSDPSYISPAAVQEEQVPPMPPRPSRQLETKNSSSITDRPPYAYWENQGQSGSLSVEEQLRMDEELAKKLAMEDEMRPQQRRLEQQRQEEEEEDSIFNFQDELPLIKEKMKEAGNVAKKKMLNLYNQFKANTQKNMNQNQHESVGASSMPTMNARYRGLPSDDGDDLLTGDISALHLSDYDVYAKTGGGGGPRKSNEYRKTEDTIYVNPPLNSSPNTLTNLQTSTSEAQLKADEDFARQLAEEEAIEARRLSSNSNNSNLQPPQMPPRKPVSPTVVISTRSPLEFEGDSDYEDVGLNAAPTDTINSKSEAINNDDKMKDILEEVNSSNVPYVIGDDDDSDSEDNLIDDIEEENKLKREDTTTTKDEETKETEIEAKTEAVIRKSDDDKDKDENSSKESNEKILDNAAK